MQNAVVLAFAICDRYAMDVMKFADADKFIRFNSLPQSLQNEWNSAWLQYMIEVSGFDFTHVLKRRGFTHDFKHPTVG